MSGLEVRNSLASQLIHTAPTAPPAPAPTVGSTPEGVKKAEGGFSDIAAQLHLSNKPANPAQVRDVVYIGVGASTAYSLAVRNQETLGTLQASGVINDQPYAGKVTVIGKSDAWEASVRGAGDINHQHELIDHWGTFAPGFDAKVASREDFAKQNAGQILQAVQMGAEAIANSVKHVKRQADGTFLLTLADNQEVKAKKVVVASGAGAHTAVDHASYHPDKPRTDAENSLLKNNHISLPEGLRDKAMDLDTFMRKTDFATLKEWEGKTVVVHGPNAGIDAVERAGKLGANVVWLSRTSDPVLLDGNALEHAPRIAAEQDVIKASDTTITGGDDGRLKFEIETYKTDKENKVIKEDGKEVLGGPKVTLSADVYVYALGQDGYSVDRKSGEVAVGGFLGDLVSSLEPQYDINQAFSDKPYETVLGFQVKNDPGKGYAADTGLEVIGAAASTIATKIPHNYLDKSLADLESAAQKDLGGEQAAKLLQAVKSGDQKAAKDLVKQVVDAHSKNPLGLNAKDFIAHGNILRHVQQSVERYFEADAFFNPKPKAGAEAPAKKEFANKELDATNRTQVASVLQAAQLGAVKASVGALGTFIPGYVQNGEANFSTDNRTQLRVFIAQNFPNITDAQADSFINDVITMRHRGSKDAQEARAKDLLGHIVRANARDPLDQKHLAEMLIEGGIKPLEAPRIASTLMESKGPLEDPTAPRPKDAKGKDIPLSSALKDAIDLVVDSWGSKDAHTARATELLGEIARTHAQKPVNDQELAQLLTDGGVRAFEALPIARVLLDNPGALEDPTLPRPKDANGADVPLSKASTDAIGLLSGSWGDPKVLIPALGTPDQVRDAYMAELQRLNSNSHATATPAVRAWVQV